MFAAIIKNGRVIYPARKNRPAQPFTPSPLKLATAQLIAELVGTGRYTLTEVRTVPPKYPDNSRPGQTERNYYADDSTADDWMFDGMLGK